MGNISMFLKENDENNKKLRSDILHFNQQNQNNTYFKNKIRNANHDINDIVDYTLSVNKKTCEKHSGKLGLQ
jgi:hypothetical protein